MAQLRVYRNRLEVEPLLRSAKVIPLRHIVGVKLGWAGTLKIRTTEGEELSFNIDDPAEVHRVISENLP